MQYEKVAVQGITLIGKEGSTLEGEGMIARLWEDANAHFSQIEALARKDETGTLRGIWGAMSDLSRSFAPWEEGFSVGLYLAGVECLPEAVAPAGWTKWELPPWICLQIPQSPKAFEQGLNLLVQEGLTLAGAVQEFTDPKTGAAWLRFPIEKL